jgi:hypothetical protein
MSRTAPGPVSSAMPAGRARPSDCALRALLDIA